MKKIKKSQMKIQEMSFMIIAIVIFFALVFLFYLSYSLSGLKSNTDISLRAKNVLLVEFLAGTPEFSCAYSKMVCVDEDKLLSLNNHVIYSSFWDVDGLVVERVYPKMNKEVECSLSNYPYCSKYTLVMPKKDISGVGDSSFIALCRKEYTGYSYEKCDLGKIIVWTKQNEN